MNCVKAPKQYTGYRSFQYLRANLDYEAFALAAETDRVPSHPVSCTREQEARVQTLLDNVLVISLHDHPTIVPEDPREIFRYRRQGRDFTGYEGLSRSKTDVIFDNMNDGTALITSKSGWKWDDILYDMGMRLCDFAHQDFVMVVRTIADIQQAYDSGRVGIVLTLEAATPIENEIDRLDILYGLGVRCMGLVYSEANALGSGLKEARDGGLTQLGRQAVRRMNQLGIAIDVAHTGDQTALDAIDVSEKPIFITHSGARALWNTARMKPDDVIKACAARGGVFGVEAAPHTTLTERHKSHSIESVMEHFEYIANLVGLDHVAFGPDTLFGDHVALHHAFAQQLSIESAHVGPAFEEVPFVDGIENPGENFHNITRWLVAHGYSDGEIAKVLGQNILRVLQQVWV
ncbi:MAG: diguanylate cyclase [Sulfobacillus acidophilus]|uniref:Diguanylate cyclase n=1 Tax=Sulfobacillus acidophilus TaxID=53633 RepID=A0A2T2WFN6_9FIRM|nr:MAG: diguanylate cyclase [Sulfobacillus acidophilus]